MCTVQGAIYKLSCAFEFFFFAVFVGWGVGKKRRRRGEETSTSRQERREEGDDS
jgi:hypothetical protein